MTTEIFGPLHAAWYDRWHHNKDYPAEAAQLREVFAAHGDVKSVLDLGCGTARHLELLAADGFEVGGVDRAPVMVAQAQERLAAFGTRASITEGDLLTIRLDRRFDAVIMMFSVLGYLVTTRDLQRALASARSHLGPGGLLVVDILDGTAILANGPRGGFSVTADGDLQLLRATSGAVDTTTQVYEMGVRLWLLEGTRVLDHAEETHAMRYFLPRELDLVLDLAGFEALGSAPVAGSGAGPAREWSKLVWARAR